MKYTLPFQVFVLELAGTYNEEFYTTRNGYYFINFGLAKSSWTCINLLKIEYLFKTRLFVKCCVYFLLY